MLPPPGNISSARSMSNPKDLGWCILGLLVKWGSYLHKPQAQNSQSPDASRKKIKCNKNIWNSDSLERGMRDVKASAKKMINKREKKGPHDSSISNADTRRY